MADEDDDFSSVTIIPLVIRRLGRQLPIVTGFSAEETLADDLVGVVREFITAVPGRGLFPESLEGFMQVIETVIERDWDTPLEQRPRLIQESLLVLTQLLAEIAESEWNATGSSLHPRDCKFFRLKNSRQYDLYSRWIGQYTRPADHVPEVVAQEAVNFFMRLKSTTRLKRIQTFVVREQPYRGGSVITTQIDAYIDTVILYLSASNWSTCYTYAWSLISSLNRTSSSRELETLQKLDITSLLYLTTDRVTVLLRDFRLWLQKSRRPLHRNLIEIWFHHSIMHWIQCQPAEAAEASRNPDHPLRKEAQAFMDQSFKDSKDNRNIATWLFLATLAILVPDGYTAPSGPFTKMNSRRAFLEALNGLRNSTTPRSLGICAMSYAVLTIAASAIYTADPTNPLVSYAVSIYGTHLDLLFGAHDPLPAFARIDMLQARFISSYLVMVPESVKKDLIRRVTSPSLDLDAKRNIITGLRTVHSIPRGHDIIHDVLDDHYTDLIELITILGDDLYQYESDMANFDPSEFDVQVETLRLSLDMLLSHSEEILQELPESFSRTLVRCSVSKNDSLRLSTTEALFEFVKSKRSSVGPDQTQSDARSGHIVIAIHNGISMNLKTSAEAILTMKLTSRQLEKELRKVHDFLETRALIYENYLFSEAIETSEERRKLSISLEVAMVVCLCSPNIESCKLALDNINLMVKEAIVFDQVDRETSDWSVGENLNVYSELSSQSHFYTPIAIQKKMCKLFQTIEMPSVAIIKIWAIIHDRWSLMCSDMTRSTNVTVESQKEWRSYYGVLSSLIIPLVNPEGGIKVPDNVHFKARQLIYDSVSYLISESTYVRETSRDVLANDVGPLAYHYVLKYLAQLVQTNLSTNSPNCLMLMNQSALLIKVFVERLHQEDIYTSVDIGILALDMVKYVKGMDVNSDTLKLIVRLCQLLETLGNTAEALNIKQEQRIRNSLAMLVSEWLEWSTTYECADNTNKIEVEKGRLVRDVSVAASKSLAELLKGMVIDIPEGTHEQDLLVVKFNTFNNIFSLLLRILHRCKSEESLPSNSILREKQPFIRARAIESLSHLLHANVDVGLRAALPLGYHEDTNLRLAFLEIFRNILSKQTKSAGSFTEASKYEELVDFLIENTSITLALCDICPAVDADELSSSLLSAFEFRSRSLKLVKDAVTREIEETSFATDILRRNCVATKLLSRFGKSRGQQYLSATLGPFIMRMTENPELYTFETDVSKLRTEQEVADNSERYSRCLGDLFECLSRNENMVPSSFRDICLTISKAVNAKFPDSSDSAVGSFFFLRFICPALVSPEQEGLLEKPPSRDVRRSLLLLAKAIQNYANLTGSKGAQENSILSDEEEKVEIVRKLLRSLCVSDEKSHGSDDTSSQVSAAKIMDMTPLHTLHRFVYNHWEDAHHKLLVDQRRRRLTQAPSRTELRTELKVAKEWDDIPVNGSIDPAGRGKRSKGTSIALLPPQAIDDDDSENNRRFAALVRSLGRPSSPAAAKAATTKRNNNNNNSNNTATNSATNNSGAPIKLTEFMARNEQRDLTSIIDKRIVHEGIGKDGTPLLIVTFRNYDREAVDTELVLYRYFQVASKMWSDKFSIFYDCSGCKATNMLSNTVRSIRDTMVPPEMGKNCIGVYYYNVSTAFLPTVKSFIRHYQDEGLYMSPARTKYVFLTSADIATVCDVPGLNLDPRSEKLIDDVRLVFNHATMVVSANSSYPVGVKVGNEYLQIHGEQHFNYIKNAPGLCNDVFHFSEILEVSLTRTTGRPDEFTIETVEGEKFVLLHKHKHEILRAISNARSRIPAEEKRATKRMSMNLEDAIGCLLNVSFANLCSRDGPLQAEAFNLLATIPGRFNVDLGREVRGGDGLGIPKSEVALAVSFSEAVASANPELTYDFLYEFCKAFKSLPKEQGHNAILYAAPWVKNIYAAQADGKNDAGSLIRLFLDNIVRSPEHHTTFLLKFWATLCLEEELTEAIVDEVVSFAIERGPQEDDTDDALSVLTSYPTIGICGEVLTRCRRIIAIPLPDGERSIVKHQNWSELSVLVKLMSSLSFESVMVAEVYLPEIFSLVTGLIHTGPTSLRMSLYNLLVNVLHAFSCYDKLPVDQKYQIITIWGDLTSPKGKLLFGLSNEPKAAPHDYFSLGLVSSLENICMVLVDIITSAGTVHTANVWRSRWSSLVTAACFSDNVGLQCRSFIALGCLARIDVEDSILARVLSVLKQALTLGNSQASEEFSTSLVFCITKMMSGLFEESIYNARMFWLGIALLNARSSSLFIQGLTLIQASLKSLDSIGAFSDESVAEYLLDKRRSFEKEWSEIQSLMDVSFSVEFFDLALSAVVLKGLEKSATRSETLQALECFLEISAKNHIRSEDSKRYASYLCYLYFLFLGSRSQADLKDLLWIAGYPGDHMESKMDEDELPTLLEEYISEDSTDTTIALYLGGIIFRASSEYEVSGLRFLGSLRFVGEKNLEKKCMVYSTVRSRLLKLTEFGSQKPIMKSILAAGSGMLANIDEFRRLSEHRANLDRLLIDCGFKPQQQDVPVSSSTSTFSQSQELTAEMRGRFAHLIDAMICEA